MSEGWSQSQLNANEPTIPGFPARLYSESAHSASTDGLDCVDGKW